MCGAWRKQYAYPELTPVEVERIFSDTILNKSIRVVNVTGGEPTLRKDLIEVIRALTNTCSNLRKIDISTNGIDADEAVDTIEQALAFLLPRKVKLGVSVSLDGLGQVHDQIRGVPGAFLGVEKSIPELKELMTLYPYFSVGLNFTVTGRNCDELGKVFQYGIDKVMGINFTLAAKSEIGVESLGVLDSFALNKSQRSTVATFVKGLLERDNIHRQYGEFLLYWLATGRRRGPCAFHKGESILCEPDGTAYACGNFKDFKLGNLLETPFSVLAGRKSGFSEAYRLRCKNCNSNCYIDSAW